MSHKPNSCHYLTEKENPVYRPATTTAPRHGRPRQTTPASAVPLAPCIGTVVELSPDGQPMVTSPFQSSKVAARLLAKMRSRPTPL